METYVLIIHNNDVDVGTDKLTSLILEMPADTYWIP